MRGALLAWPHFLHQLKLDSVSGRIESLNVSNAAAIALYAASVAG